MMLQSMELSAMENFKQYENSFDISMKLQKTACLVLQCMQKKTMHGAIYMYSKP